jgi:hypothetical protein
VKDGGRGRDWQRQHEEKREREEEERARRILAEARRDREEQARKRQEQVATPAKRAKLAVKAEEAGFASPKESREGGASPKGHIVGGQEGIPACHRGKQEEAGGLAEGEAGTPIGGGTGAPGANGVHRGEGGEGGSQEEVRCRAVTAASGREESTAVPPRGKGRKAVVSPPKQPHREHIPPRDSPEFVRYVERKVDALVAAVQAAPGIGWEAGDPLPPNAHEVRRVLRDLLGAVNRFPDTELMLVSRQRSAMIPGLRFTLQTVLNMLDAALEIMRMANRSIEYDAAPNRKQIMDLVEKIRQDAEKREAARKEQEVRDSIKRQAMEKTPATPATGGGEEENKARSESETQARELQLKSLGGGTAARKKRRTKEGLASPGAEPGSPSSSSTTSSPTSPDYSPTPLPISLPTTWPDTLATVRPRISRAAAEAKNRNPLRNAGRSGQAERHRHARLRRKAR